MSDHQRNRRSESDQAVRMIADYYDGKLAESEVRQLEVILESDCVLRQKFVIEGYFHSQLYTAVLGEAMLGEAMLGEEGLGEEPLDKKASVSQEFVPQMTASPILSFLGNILPEGSDVGRTFFQSVALIGTLLLGSLAVWFAFLCFTDETPVLLPSSPGAFHVEGPSVAYVENAVLPNWNNQNASIRPDGAIILGKRIRLDSGLAKIVIRDRAEIILEGPAEFVIESTMNARLLSGRLSAHMLDDGKGFIIRGPGMSVLDLGTAFGMSVGEDGRSQVHVFQGEVEVSLESEIGKDAIHSELVTEYNAVDLDTKQGRIAPLQYDPSHFIRSLEPSDLEIGRDYIAAVKQANPVCYWRFEYFDSQGRIRNEMQDRYHGVSPTRLVLSPDVQNKTLSVDQRRYEKQYMFVKEPIEELVDSNYSIEFWFKPDMYHWTTPVMLYYPSTKEKRGEQAMSLIEFLPGAKPHYEQPPKRVRLLQRIPPSSVFQEGVNCYSNCEYQPKNWHHVVGVFDDEASHLYVNGVLVASASIEGKITKPPLVSIGRTPSVISSTYRDLVSEMIGQIDEVAIYPAALSEQEIHHHFEIAKP